MTSVAHLRLRASPAEICTFSAVEDFRSEDSRSEIYPQSRSNSVIEVVDKDAAVGDGAVVVDLGSAVRIVAGRPQPPPAIAIAGFACGALCVAVCRSLTLTLTVRAEVLFRFRDAQQEHLIRRAANGSCA